MEYTGMKNVLKEFFKRLKTYLSSNYETIANVDLIENDITDIKGKIPSSASSSNQLTDKEYVDNIPEATLSKLGNGGTVSSITDSSNFVLSGNKLATGSQLLNYIKANLVTTCSTGASTQDKAITLSNHTLKAGDIIAVTFKNANTYGDCTLLTPTYPRLKVNGGTAYQICDNMGHSAGTGCWEAGNTVVFMFTGNKFIILNSIIRQQNKNKAEGYKIYSNNYVEQWRKVTKSVTINEVWGALYDSEIFVLKFKTNIANTIIGDDVSVFKASDGYSAIIEYDSFNKYVWLCRATPLTNSTIFTVGRFVTGWL